MSTLHDFLLEHAKFPFPDPDELRGVATTDISELEVGMLEIQWKAKRAVCDNTLVQKLCHTLENILGPTLLQPRTASYLRAKFSPEIRLDELGRQDRKWSTNPDEAHSRRLLDIGVFEAGARCLFAYEGYDLTTKLETLVEGARSKVDYVVLVNDEIKVLCEAKSPSVMKAVRESLPPHGIELKWVRGQSLIPRILEKAALYLGLRQMEWLFLTCHNYWIVCRLVRHDDHPYLAYSPMISIDESSEPFRAFLAAILSVVKNVPVEPSAYSPDMQLDIIKEEEDHGPTPEDDIDDSSGAYRGGPSSEVPTSSRITRSVARGHGNTESELMVTSSSPRSPECSQVWMHLYAMSNNTFVLPQCARSNKQRLWLTRLVGYGSTGNVWQCHFDNSNDSFAVKIVELLRHSDAESRQRLRNEFDVYLTLEKAYQTGELHNHIAPHCYGAFEAKGVDVLIIDLCDGILDEWDELSASEKAQVYKLVQDLHSIGIEHGDLEPRNVVRGHGGGFLLIDFSESRKHICKESKVGELHTTLPTPVHGQTCSELQTLRNLLWKRQPLQTRVVNLG